MFTEVSSFLLLNPFKHTKKEAEEVTLCERVTLTNDEAGWTTSKCIEPKQSTTESLLPPTPKI